jgi:hypothetical protein
MPHLLLLLVAASLAGCATATVYGTVGDRDDLYTGTAIGFLDRTGTIELTNTAGNRCSGNFAYYSGVLRGHGIVACDDGQRADIAFEGLTPLSGYGGGASGTGRPVTFTYGLGREQSLRYLGFTRPPRTN